MYLVCSEINRKSAQQSVVCYEIIVTSSKQAEGKLHLKKIAKKRSVVPLRWCLGMQIDLTREGAHRRSLFGCFLFQVKAHVILSVMRRIIKWEEDKCPIEVFLPMRVHLLCTSPRSCTLTTLSEAKQAFITNTNWKQNMYPEAEVSFPLLFLHGGFIFRRSFSHKRRYYS